MQQQRQHGTTMRLAGPRRGLHQAQATPLDPQAPLPVTKGPDQTSLRAQLQAIDGVPHDRVLLVRKVQHLGLGSAEAVQAHCSSFGEVDSIHVAHAPGGRGCPQRIRPSNLAIVVMGSAEEAERVHSAGAEQVIQGRTVRIERFERRAAGGSAGSDSPSSNPSLSTFSKVSTGEGTDPPRTPSFLSVGREEWYEEGPSGSKFSEGKVVRVEYYECAGQAAVGDVRQNSFAEPCNPAQGTAQVSSSLFNAGCGLFSVSPCPNSFNHANDDFDVPNSYDYCAPDDFEYWATDDEGWF